MRINQKRPRLLRPCWRWNARDCLIPCHSRIIFQLLLAFLHERSESVLRHFDAAVAQQQRYAVDRDAFIEQLNGERVAEHVRVTNDPRITAAVFVRVPLYVALPDSHRAALKKAVTLRDLNLDTWGLFSEKANPNAHDAIMRLVQREKIVPHEIHEVLGAPDAFHVVTEQNGIAFVSEATALSTHIDGVVFRPLSDESLRFDTCLVTRAETSRLIDQFGMEFLRKYSRQSLSATQMSLGETA